MNQALNFDTDDTAVIGGCDLYTTKAAGSDKKLYKRIEATLEERYKELEDAVKGLSMSPRIAEEMNLDRNTPFGSFKEPSNRHKFAYFIATLNATHVDYDFANTLNTDEFRRESMHEFMRSIDAAMRNLRPQFYSQNLSPGTMTPLGSPVWNPRSWHLLDSEIDLQNCEFYAWEPTDDPFADDGAIWTHHHFLFNKERKRVCYFYLRGISALSSSPAPAVSLMTRFKQSQYESSPNAASRKRTEYWLGHRARRGLQYYGESDELDNMVIDHPGDVVDADDVVDLRDRETSLDVDYCDSDDESDVGSIREREKSAARRMSENFFGARMELV